MIINKDSVVISSFVQQMSVDPPEASGAVLGSGGTLVGRARRSVPAGWGCRAAGQGIVPQQVLDRDPDSEQKGGPGSVGVSEVDTGKGSW